jgi:ATP-binding cassette subfamily B protein
VQEDLASVRELRGYGADGWRHQLLGELSMSYTAHALGLARWRSALIPVVGAGTGASLLTVLWAGGRGVIAGALSIGELVAFTLYVGLLAWPTMSIGWTMSLWQRGLAAWTRLREVLDARSWDEARPAGGAAVSAATAPAIEVRGLSLAEGGARILDDVALEVPAGGLCAIVGRVGSGKSTLVEAIAGLRAVPPGSLWIDGREAGELDVAARRRLVAYAPQSAFLFSATIRENIGWGIDGDAGAGDADARIERAARAAGLEADLAQLPDGLDTLVGERGLTLSGGQRQRIALARALVSERPLLILDDSLSSVDAETERAILAGIDAELAGRTALLVSHRLSALQHARQVIVLERGRVVERGAPRELLERGGLYAQLYRGQQLEEAIRG